MVIKMSIKRKIVSLFTGAALILTSALAFSGCSQSGAYAVTVEGEQFPAGLYILYSGNAYANATQALSEEQPDLKTSEEGFDYYAQTVSGMPFADYVKQETLDLCKRHIAVNKLFDSLGIALDEAQQDNLNDYINEQWDYDLSSWNTSEAFSYLNGAKTLGGFFESIGVSKSSFRQYNLNSYRASEIFDHYYGKGGVEEVSEEEINGWIDDNYALTRYFGISLNDGNGNLIETKSQLAVLENMAEDYKDKLNDGGSFADVYGLYQEYSAMTAAEEETPEDTGTSSDGETTEAPAERSKRSPDNDGANAAFSADDENAPEETEADTQADTTTPPESVTEEAETDAEPPADEEPAETTAAKKDSDYNTLVAKTSTTPSEEFVKALFEQESNTAAVFKADTYYYVVQKLDILATDGTEEEGEIDYVKRYSSTALQELRGDTMEDVFKEAYAAYTLTENDAAPDYCRQQALNALNGLTTITQIQYQYQYYQQLMGGLS